MNRLLTMRDAATYCQNLPLTYFRNQIKLGAGPAYALFRPNASSSTQPIWKRGWPLGNTQRQTSLAVSQ